MAEADLRASTLVLAGTTSNDWPMVAHGSGHGGDPPRITAPWAADNMQYSGVLIFNVGAYDLRIRVLDAGGADVTPPTWTDDQQVVLDGKGYVALANPSGATPPGVPGGPGYSIALDALPHNGPWPNTDWEFGIFKRVPYTPPPPAGGGGGTLGPCPPRPDWPYPPPSISGFQGRIGVTRGARR